MYDTEILPTLISRVTNAVIEQVIEWQARPLGSAYPIVYLDCLVVKIRQDKQAINKVAYLALGVNIEGLKGFPEAINTVFPLTQVQLCIVHMVRNLMKYVLRKAHQAVIEEEVLLELDNFCSRWDDKYPQISRSWHVHWTNLNTLFKYPQDIRKAIYTTNAIESLNSVIRKAIKNANYFPMIIQR